jgi:tRNA-dihydrouridine synthase
MNFFGFWENLEKPIVGLSPMDGVTDAVFRYMLADYGKPSVIFTEFTNVEGLARGAEKMLRAFLYDEIERPIVAQVFGVEVDSFYKSAVMLCEMGFDGIDINMGCPAKHVAAKGSGAGLIKTPDLARKIIRSVKLGAQDWANGISMEKAGVHKNIISAIDKMKGEKVVERKLIPVSVKTRVGVDGDIAEDWVGELIKEKPALVTMHGRTLRQMYSGEADWEILGRASLICKDAGVMFLGNGDVKSLDDAREKTLRYNLDGVLIGRSVMGNPWFFSDKIPSVEDRISALKDHCSHFERIFGDEVPFHAIKKHLAWYLKGFEGVKEIRMQLMMSSSFEEVRDIISKIE